jgi:hypothetical protein
MAIVKGSSSPTRGVATDQTFGFNATNAVLVRDVGSSIFYLDPSASPFTLLTTRAGSKVATNPRFEWWEKSLRPRTANLEADAPGTVDGTTDGTTLTVQSGDVANVFQVGDLVYNPARSEIYRVTAQVAAREFTVTRGAAGTSASASGADGDDLFIIGNAQAEGIDVGQADEWQETHVYNFTQINRRAFGASRTREGAEAYTGKTRPRLRAEKAIEHAMQIELAYMFGGRSEDTTTSNAPIRTTGGFTFFATSNQLDLAGSSLSEPDLEGWLEDVFAHTTSGDSRLLLASPALVSALDMLAVDKIRTVSDKNLTYGIAVSQYQTAHGSLNIVKHRLMADGGSAYAAGGFAVDVKKLMNRPYVDGGSTKLYTNRQGNGVDGWLDEYLTESGLQLANPEVHGTIINVGAAA